MIKCNINVKWFSCDKCDSKFKTRAQLNRHQKTHITDIKSSPQSARSQASSNDFQWHKCNICKKTFKFKDNLIRHLHETHRIGIQEHIKRYKCYYCNIHFKRHSAMTRHCAQVHKERVPSLTWIRKQRPTSSLQPLAKKQRQQSEASETADVPLERQNLKDTKLQTQSLQEQTSKTAG